MADNNVSAHEISDDEAEMQETAIVNEAADALRSTRISPQQEQPHTAAQVVSQGAPRGLPRHAGPSSAQAAGPSRAVHDDRPNAPPLATRSPGFFQEEVRAEFRKISKGRASEADIEAALALFEEAFANTVSQSGHPSPIAEARAGRRVAEATRAPASDIVEPSGAQEQIASPPSNLVRERATPAPAEFRDHFMRVLASVSEVSDQVTTVQQSYSTLAQLVVDKLHEVGGLRPEKFDGKGGAEKAETWFTMFWRWCEATKRDQAKTIEFFLVDEAAQWFCQVVKDYSFDLLDTSKPAWSIEALRQEFVANFGRPRRFDAYDVREKLLKGEHSMRRDDTVHSYKQKLNRLFRKAGKMEELDKIAWAHKGMERSHPELYAVCGGDAQGNKFSSLTAFWTYAEGKFDMLKRQRECGASQSHGAKHKYTNNKGGVQKFPYNKHDHKKSVAYVGPRSHGKQGGDGRNGGGKRPRTAPDDGKPVFPGLAPLFKLEEPQRSEIKAICEKRKLCMYCYRKNHLSKDCRFKDDEAGSGGAGTSA